MAVTPHGARTIDSTLPADLTWAEVRYLLVKVGHDRRVHSRNYSAAISHDNIIRRESVLASMRKLDALIERLTAVDDRFAAWDEATFGPMGDASNTGQE